MIIFQTVLDVSSHFVFVRGPRFWALGVDSGPLGGLLGGCWTPEKWLFLSGPKGRLRNAVHAEPRLSPGVRSSGAHGVPEGRAYPGLRYILLSGKPYIL